MLEEVPFFFLTFYYVIVQHTSASLMLNENADPDVRKDMDMGLDKIVPETFPYIHTDEGPDDMVIYSLS